MIQWSLEPENVIDSVIPDVPFTADEETIYLQMVYAGLITKYDLSDSYHRKITKYLTTATHQGFGDVGLFNPISLEAITIESLDRNIFMFSAAKQYQQVRVMSDYIYALGDRSTWNNFKALGEKTFSEFNKTWLKTEFTTAVGQAQSARDWVEFEKNKDLFPLLEYHTQHDGRVRPEHAMLNGIKRNIDDKFWNDYMPKNSWNCRCFVTSTDKGRETDLTKREVPAFDGGDFPPLFKMNPGKDMMVFNPAIHPYWQVAKGDSGLKKRNFNLPLK